MTSLQRLHRAFHANPAVFVALRLASEPKEGLTGAGVIATVADHLYVLLQEH